jgi:hypothetical protein
MWQKIFQRGLESMIGGVELFLEMNIHTSSTVQIFTVGNTDDPAFSPSCFFSPLLHVIANRDVIM